MLHYLPGGNIYSIAFHSRSESFPHKRHAKFGPVEYALRSLFDTFFVRPTTITTRKWNRWNGMIRPHAAITNSTMSVITMNGIGCINAVMQMTKRVKCFSEFEQTVVLYCTRQMKWFSTATLTATNACTSKFAIKTGL